MDRIGGYAPSERGIEAYKSADERCCAGLFRLDMETPRGLACVQTEFVVTRSSVWVLSSSSSRSWCHKSVPSLSMSNKRRSD